MTRHLDLGCGGKPRNPYGMQTLYGVDLVVAQPSERFKACNVAVDPLPFPDNYFDSVSAYDFLEHVPRVLLTADGRGTRAPFIELMNEIWRVLKPCGLLYARTPAYPHASAFKDPTHVNIIADATVHYFTRPKLEASIYGFKGDFAVRRHGWIDTRNDYEPLTQPLGRRIHLAWRRKRRRLSHLLWEFEACK